MLSAEKADQQKKAEKNLRLSNLDWVTGLLRAPACFVFFAGIVIAALAASVQAVAMTDPAFVARI